jgi:hypothetical protein
MTTTTSKRVKLDESVERQFILDYAGFALRLNFETVIVLYEKALTIEDSILRKSICLSGMQFMFSSWEDFALLLQAFRIRKEKGLPVYRYLWREGQSKGSSDVPSIFKRYESARQMLDELGFTAINHRLLTRYYTSMSKSQFKVVFRAFPGKQSTLYKRSMSKAQFESIFSGLADEIKSIGAFQQEYNELKNRLKHGKGIIEGVEGTDNSDRVAYLKLVQNTNDELQLQWVKVSLTRLKSAVVQVAQLYIRSLELFWLFMLQYYPTHVEDVEAYRKIYIEQSKQCVKKLRALEFKIIHLIPETKSNTFNPAHR